MKLEVHRRWLDAIATEGELWVDGVKEAYTLEPPFRSDDVKPRAIPCGTYQVKILLSEKHNRFLPHVMDVPGFEAIEIHIGNWPKDTLGCLLVGTTRGDDAIFGSTAEFNSLYPRIKEACDAGDVYITYSQDPAPPVTPA